MLLVLPCSRWLVVVLRLCLACLIDAVWCFCTNERQAQQQLGRGSSPPGRCHDRCMHPPEFPRARRYGSNSCTFKWGEKVGVTYNVSTGELTADNKLELSVKLDKIIPLKVSCSVCGDTCEIKIPGKPIKIPLPPCPIKAQSLHNTTFFTFPAKDPLLDTIITGTITLSDASGATMDKVDINADASPSA